MFKIGQKVVCIAPFEKKGSLDNGVTWSSDETSPHPNIGDIVVIVDIEPDHGSLSLYGYPRNFYYDCNKFRPLDESFADDVLAMITEQIKEEELVTV